MVLSIGSNFHIKHYAFGPHPSWRNLSCKLSPLASEARVLSFHLKVIIPTYSKTYLTIKYCKSKRYSNILYYQWGLYQYFNFVFYNLKNYSHYNKIHKFLIPNQDSSCKCLDRLDLLIKWLSLGSTWSVWLELVAELQIGIASFDLQNDRGWNWKNFFNLRGQTSLIPSPCFPSCAKINLGW
jgi:hypothetical protein